MPREDLSLSARFLYFPGDVRVRTGTLLFKSHARREPAIWASQPKPIGFIESSTGVL